MNALIQKYLLHVKSHLPKKLRDDVAEELGESLQSRLDEHERAAGQPMSDDRIAEMLTEFGHPIEVAGRYLPRQYLIGPSTFPAYWYSLKALVIVFAAIAVVRGIVAISTQDWRTVIDAVGDTAWALLAWGGILTVVFVAFDESGFKFFDRFTPRQLAARPFLARGLASEPIPRFESAFDFVLQLTVLVWWVTVLPAAPISLWQIEMQWGESYAWFFYPIVALLLAGLLRAARNFLRPYWTSPALVARVFHVAAWIGVMIWMVRTPNLLAVEITNEFFGPERAERLVTEVGRSLRIVLYVFVFIGAVRIAIDVSRMLRR